MATGIEVITVKGWSRLEELLFSDFWPELNRHRTKRVFRGLTDATFPLTTTLQRMGGCSSKLETKLLRQFKKYAHRQVAMRETDWHCLAIAQHHGLPTRFLDWTNSPFVALHFASADWPNSGTDGVVWALGFESIKECLPDRLKNKLDELHVNVFTTAELEQIVPAVQDLQSLEDPSGREFMVLFEPPSLDARIVNQYAALSALSRPDTTPEDWLKERKTSVCQKIIIPRHLKATLRERLDMMNMTERVLYPGLDGLTAWLRRYYGPQWPDAHEPQPVFRGKYVDVFRSETGWEYLQRRYSANGVAIIAVTKDNRLILIDQYRHPVNKRVIELPAGVIDPGTTKEKTAKSELEQETGYICDSLTYVCDGALSPGLVNEINAIYRATGLVRTSDTGKDTIEVGDVIHHGVTYGNAGEGESIQAWEVPLNHVRAWLQERRQAGAVIDLRIYAALSFFNATWG